MTSKSECLFRKPGFYLENLVIYKRAVLSRTPGIPTLSHTSWNMMDSDKCAIIIFQLIFRPRFTRC